jgi:dihydroorotate dehydrogenase
LEQTVWDQQFPNPVGLAAGYDKNAQVVHTMAALAFGFVEAPDRFTKTATRWRFE